jgi:glutamine synthetase type III
MEILMKKILFTLPILISLLTACSDVQTKDDLSTLSMEGFAIKACEEMLAANFEQLKIMLDESDFKKLKNSIEKRPDSWASVSDRMSCEIKTTKPLKGKPSFTLNKAYLT